MTYKFSGDEDIREHFRKTESKIFLVKARCTADFMTIRSFGFENFIEISPSDLSTIENGLMAIAHRLEEQDNVEAILKKLESL